MVTFQHFEKRGLFDGGTPPNGPPDHARLFRIAAGLAQWTPQEMAWLRQNPKVLAYCDEVRMALDASDNAEGDLLVAGGMRR